MSERLTVEKFGGLDHAVLELGKITVLIGPQAAGKSICAKLLYYFKGFIDEIHTTIVASETRTAFNKKMISKFTNYFPEYSWPYSFKIQYNFFDTRITIQRSSGKKIHLSYSDEYVNAFNKSRQTFRTVSAYEENQEEEARFSESYFRSRDTLIRSITKDGALSIPLRQVFIPAGRSFFSNIQQNIFSLLSSNQEIDPFLVEFGSRFEGIKRIARRHLSPSSEKSMKMHAKITEVFNSVMSGNCNISQNSINYNDGRTVNIKNASSGQQEFYPLAVMLYFASRAMYIRNGTTIYIEEPEAHLFPSSQREVVELVSAMHNASEENLQFVITTHSPYILSSFNTLLYAGIRNASLDEKKQKDLAAIVPVSQQLKPNTLRSYALHSGKQQALLSADTGLIDAEYIDSVSHEIALTFGKILDL